MAKTSTSIAIFTACFLVLTGLATWLLVALPVYAAEEEQTHFGVGLKGEVMQRIKDGAPVEAAVKSALADVGNWEGGHSFRSDMASWGFTWETLVSDGKPYLRLRFNHPHRRTMTTALFYTPPPE